MPKREFNMSSYDIEELLVENVEVGERRPLDEKTVEALAKSIAEIGLQTPITVRVEPEMIVDGEHFIEVPVLVAGGHRLAAVKRLGWQRVPAVVLEAGALEAELWELDENLCRAELSPAQVAEHTARRKAIYEKLHGKAKARGAAAANEAMGRDATDNLADAFSTDTATKSGRSERSVRRAAARGTKVVPEALAKVQGTRLDTGAYLDGLKKLPREAQLERVERDLAPPPECKPAKPGRETEAPRIAMDLVLAGPDVRQECASDEVAAKMARIRAAAGIEENESVERRRWRREARELFQRAPDPVLVSDLVILLISEGYGFGPVMIAGSDDPFEHISILKSKLNKLQWENDRLNAEVQTLKREFAAERRKLKEKMKTANARRQDAERYSSRLREELRQLRQRLEVLQMQLDRAHGRMEADAEEPALEHLDHSDQSPPAAGHDLQIDDDDDMPDIPAFLRRSKAPAERA